MRKSTLMVSLVMVLLLFLTMSASGSAASDPEIEVSLARGRAVLARDDYGVPHVMARDTSALFFGVGYAQAQDRLWQAEMLRRTALGTMAELFGPDALPGDVFMRTLYGSAERRAELLAAAKPETRLIFNAFTDGFNAWIDEAVATDQLPIEFQIFGFVPRHWTPDDVVALQVFMVDNFSNFGGDELTFAAELEALIALHGVEDGVRVFADTHWLNDPSAPTTVPASAMTAVDTGRATEAARSAAATLSQFDLTSLTTQLRAAEEGRMRNLERSGVRRGPASNAVVLNAAMSATDKPLLLGGPQMGHSAPQIIHEMGWHGAGFDAIGMQFAGMPVIPAGAARTHAWTLASGGTDVADVYLEQLNPDDPTQYLYQEAWHSMDCREEWFSVAGLDDVPQTVCETIHGPILASDGLLAASLKAPTWGQELVGYEATLDFARGTNLKRFGAAIRRMPYNFNVLYADARGNIAFWHTGNIPVRAPGDDPWMPHDGTGSAEWVGYVPWSDMPRSINPAQGWLANWNNKPAVAWESAGADFTMWGPVMRVNTLNQLLSGMTPGTATIADLEALNQTAGWTTDSPSGTAMVFVSTLLEPLLAHVDTTVDPRLPAVVAELERWDWQQLDLDADGEYDAPAVAIFNTWWESIEATIFADDLAGMDVPHVVGNLVHRMLDADPALPLQHDYLNGATATAAVTDALINAVDLLTETYGSAEIGAWLQPTAMIFWAPVGAGSVPDTIWMNRGTYNQIVQPSLTGNRAAINVVAPGQSGDPFSPHFADQLDLYATWQYKPMRITRSDLAGHIESVEILIPPR